MEPGDEKRPVTRAQIAAAEEAARQLELAREAGTASPQPVKIPVAGDRPAQPQADADGNPPADGARGGDPGAGGNEPKQEPTLGGGTPLPGNDQAGQPRDAEPEADPAQVNGAAGLLQPAAGHADDQQGDGHQAEPLIDFQPVPARPPQPELGGGMRPVPQDDALLQRGSTNRPVAAQQPVDNRLPALGHPGGGQVAAGRRPVNERHPPADHADTPVRRMADTPLNPFAGPSWADDQPGEDFLQEDDQPYGRQQRRLDAMVIYEAESVAQGRCRRRAERQMSALKEMADSLDAGVSALELVHPAQVQTALRTLQRTMKTAQGHFERASAALLASQEFELRNSGIETWETFLEEVDNYETLADASLQRIDDLKQQVSAEKRARDEAARRASTTPSLETELRLPKHELPKFAGTCVDWPVFWNQFKIAIDDRPLPEIHKFVYLKSCLTGEALELVKALLIVDTSYYTALTLLRHRYEDSRVLLRDHLDALLNVQPAHANNHSSLRRVVSVFQDRFTGLENAGVSTGYVFLTHLLTRKLDPETRRAWELAQASNAKWDEFVKSQRGRTDGPSCGGDGDCAKPNRNPVWDTEFRDLLAFLFERLQVVERTTGRDAPRKAGPATVSAPAQAPSSQNKSAPRPTRQDAGVVNKYPSAPSGGSLGTSSQGGGGTKPKTAVADACPQCKQKDHTHLAKCPLFIKMSVTQRFAVVKQARACFNCLSPFHGVRECTSNYACRDCGRRRHHHSLLHTAAAANPASEVLDAPSANVGTAVVQPPDAGGPVAAVDERSVVDSPSPGSLAVNGTTVFLCTALVPIISAFGEPVKLRAMFDTGSQVDLISEAGAKKIGHDIRGSGIQVQGVGGGRVTDSSGQITFTILTPGSRRRVTCHVMPQVVGPLPTCRLPARFMKQFEGYPLADPDFQSEKPVDLLIGMGHYHTFVLEERVVIDSMVLQNTVFGWAVTGRPSTRPRARKAPPRAASSSMVVVTSAEEMPTIYHDNDEHVPGVVTENGLLEFERFWETEEPPRTGPVPLKAEAQFCVSHYDTTTVFEEDGRARCALPFKPEASKLGNSRAQAMRRFLNIEARCKADAKLGEEYQKFMKEFLDLGHLEPVPDDEEETLDCDSYYLPHHGVLKESSTTTKLRVVFDASAKTTTGVSLNSCLAIGPRIQDTIFHILVRFRFHRIGLAADVAKMYRQIALDGPSKDFHRICWRDKPEEPIKVYRMTRVTYGVTSSSYHAIRTLQDASEFCKYPETARAIRQDFYVDDLLGGADTEAGAMALREDMVQALAKRQLPIRKWCSNSNSVLRQIPEADRETATVVVAPDDYGVKTLGVGWSMAEDCFVFLVPDALKTHPILDTPGVPLTRRKLLSGIATVFDPLGWISPLTVRMKILFQRSWDVTKDWNDLLPPDTCEAFRQWIQDLVKTEFLLIPRRVVKGSLVNHPFYELHLFCDASEQAMAACVYVVSKTGSNSGPPQWEDLDRPWAHLLCAKTKLAPRKTLSVPRLELGAMLLGVKLVTAIKEAMKDVAYRCTFVRAYSDSTVALCWTKSSPSRWGTFVANRVTSIQEVVPPDEWFHVPGEMNPADLATRAARPDMVPLSLWWYGPEFLRDGWFPEQPVLEANEETPERRKTPPVVGVMTRSQIKNLPQDAPVPRPRRKRDKTGKRRRGRRPPPTPASEKLVYKPLFPVSDFSCFGRLLNVVSCTLRARNRLVGRETGPGIEREALELLVRQEQAEHLGPELEALRATGQVPRTSKFLRLHPILHQDGTMRLGGRLSRAVLDEDEKHPFLLPRESPLVTLLLTHIHARMYHAGAGILLTEFRKRFWTSAAKTLARRIVHDCVKCARYNARAEPPVMADLPAPRVNPSPPFTHVGVDYAGPFKVSMLEGGDKDTKAYILIFVCFATKAVHIEVTIGLDISETMMALRRFIGRRGTPEKIYSDNGTGLMGARTRLCDFEKLFSKKWGATKFNSQLLRLGIEWTTIPPAGPHMGGLWEAAVKSAKGLFKRQFAHATMNLVQFQTVMAEIEGILNSRPLAPYTEDEDDLLAITPSMLLTGFKHQMFPCLPGRKPAQLAVSKDPVQRYRYLQSLISQFWTTWKTEYLNTLQAREKFQRSARNFEVGELVLLQDENFPPSEWPLARILETHKGQDGVVRSVHVRTQRGNLDRPVVKLRRLPVHLEREDGAPKNY